jgi:hypothetical protein
MDDEKLRSALYRINKASPPLYALLLRNIKEKARERKRTSSCLDCIRINSSRASSSLLCCATWRSTMPSHRSLCARARSSIRLIRSSALCWSRLALFRSRTLPFSLINCRSCCCDSSLRFSARKNARGLASTSLQSSRLQPVPNDGRTSSAPQ